MRKSTPQQDDAVSRAAVDHRDRNVILLLVVLIIVLGSAGAYSVQSYFAEYAEQRNRAEALVVSEEELAACDSEVSWIGTAECLLDKAKSSGGAARNAADLKAQQDMSVWAQAMFWASLVAIVVSAGGIVLIYESLRETRRMTVATREIGEQQSRAYVRLSKLVLKNEIGHFLLKGEFSFANDGKTPALNVAYQCDTYLQSYAEHKRTKVPSADHWNSVGSIAPGEVRLFKFVVAPILSIEKRIEEIKQRVSDAFGGEHWTTSNAVHCIEVEGRVVYRDVYGHELFSEFHVIFYLEDGGESIRSCELFEGNVIGDPRLRQFEPLDEWPEAETGNQVSVP